MWLKNIFVVLIISISVTQDVVAREYGSWSTGVIVNDEGLYAATVNDSGGLLGQYCFPESGSCLWILFNKIACEHESKYVSLINADSGAFAMEFLCDKRGETSRYVITDFDKMDTIVRSSQKIGIAFPMENGQFIVSRFDMYGVKSALDAMRKDAQKLHEINKNKSNNSNKKTKDLIL